ncbi:MAG TPA: hypothetical protein VEW66_04325 [Thermomicrobiales bacterium]|nr:hypothetical protein [Thermomicrobiales bacterium]
MGVVFGNSVSLGWWQIDIALWIIRHLTGLDEDMAILVNAFTNATVWLDAKVFY